MKSSEAGRSERVSESFVRRAGRPKRLDGASMAEMKEMYREYPFYSVRELAEIFEVSRMTVWRTVKGC
jgi:transposase